MLEQGRFFLQVLGVFSERIRGSKVLTVWSTTLDVVKRLITLFQNYFRRVIEEDTSASI
jgi:hypothetical protein